MSGAVAGFQNLTERQASLLQRSGHDFPHYRGIIDNQRP